MAKKDTPTVPINDDFEVMLTCAMRYALGRRTYIAGLFADYVLPLVGSLSNRELSVMLYDFETCDDFGDDCDRKAWEKLWNAVTEERNRRKVEK